MTDNEISERTNVEQGQPVMPFYINCDVSMSMRPDIQALNAAIARLIQAIRNEPVVDDIAQISITTFSDVAKVVTKLNHAHLITAPQLSIEGGTNYSSSFLLTGKVIDNDVAELKSNGYEVFRPLVFFLSDGEPQDGDWNDTFRRTLTYDKVTGTGMKAHPIFVPFGFRDAREDIMRQLAYPPEKAKWFFARTHSVDDALNGILDIIMKTVMSAGVSAQKGVTPPLPATPMGSGITSGDSEYRPDHV